MELLQFSLLDMTPYNKQSWFSLIGSYNQAIWPYSLLALLFMVAIPLLLFKHDKAGVSSSHSVRLVLILLGQCWLWCGVVFHWQHFANLNWAAPWFGWLFIVQGVLLISSGVLIKHGQWVQQLSPRFVLALITLLAGLLVYPLSGFLESRTLLQLEWFALMPAPITLVTFASLILLKTRWQHLLAIIPLLWAVISAAFATTLGLLEFYFMTGAILLYLVSLFAA